MLVDPLRIALDALPILTLVVHCVSGSCSIQSYDGQATLASNLKQFELG